MRGVLGILVGCCLAVVSAGCSDGGGDPTTSDSTVTSSSSSSSTGGSGGSGGAGGAEAVGGSASGGASPSGSYTWPTPAGWFAEGWTFPLSWAPDLAYVGIEQARSANGFFDSTSPEYWSYAFGWWLDEPQELDEATLEDALTRYYRGLCGGSFDPNHFHTSLTAGGPADGQPGKAYVGEIETYDPFDTQAAITLEVRVHVFECGSHRVVLVGASVSPFDAPIWTDVSAALASFACDPSP